MSALQEERPVIETERPPGTPKQNLRTFLTYDVPKIIDVRTTSQKTDGALKESMPKSHSSHQHTRKHQQHFFNIDMDSSQDEPPSDRWPARGLLIDASKQDHE